MLKCKDIVLYMKDLFKMNNVYDCARPFLLLLGIFGVGGNRIRQFEGVRSVRNTRFSFFMAILTTLFITPVYLWFSLKLLFGGDKRELYVIICRIIKFMIYNFTLFTNCMGCVQTHLLWKNVTMIFQILHNTDTMFKRENIKVNYWKIVLEYILLGLVSVHYFDFFVYITNTFLARETFYVVGNLVILLIHSTYHVFFTWTLLFLLIIHERYVCLNKLMLQNEQVTSILIVGDRNCQNNSLLRRISLARDIHEQLSQVVLLFSDICRFEIVGLLVVPILSTLMHTLITLATENLSWSRIFTILNPIIKIVIITGICESHKINRRILTARLRHLISFEEDRRILHQVKRYILFNHTTVAGLVDFQLADVDFTLLFTIIDLVASNMFVIYSNVRE